MVRTVGGECTGSCRLGHVFLTSPFVPPFLPFPPSRAEYTLLSPPFDSFSSFYSLYLRREERRRSRNRATGKREKERNTSSERVVVGERGTRGNEVLYLWLFLHRLFHLSFPPARDTGRAVHYNSSSPFLSLIPLVRSCCNVSFPPLRPLFFFCTPAT